MKKFSLSLVLFLSTCAIAQAQYKPEIVGSAPSDAYIGLSRLSNGELRHYNYGEQRDPGNFYLQSKDNGQTWIKVDTDPKHYHADVCNPLTNTMIRLFYNKQGVWCVRYNANQDGTSEITKVTNDPYIMIKPPVFINGGKRILIACHYVGGDVKKVGSHVLYSDDDGITWQESENIVVPLHKIDGFHKGIRWNHGAVEPTVIELNDGRIWMIMRTSQDSHYQSYSYDGGTTWTTPTPSPFYGTITMPTIGRLRDGRMLFIWSNTTSLPETTAGMGRWEDVFTNRNAIHAAISEDDGKTWIGCRELFLDEHRNAPDFATAKGHDKSVHQSQFVETEPGKIVVAVGQSPRHRKILRFDVEWLYETERNNQFENGLADWSTFHYYKGIKGHCGYNRKEGGRLVAHPTKKEKQVLNLRHSANDSLVYDGEGAVWNFPASRKGVFTTSVRIPQGSQGGSLVLNDRWFNATDTTSGYFSMYNLPLTRKALNINDDKFHTLRVEWDLNSRQTMAKVYIDKSRKPIIEIPLSNVSTHGISYVHFQTSRNTDNIGYDIEYVKAKQN
ncbi:MAG: sialidase family protein [Marinifilaceae bacterium]